MTNIEALVAEYGTVMKAYGRSLGVGDRLIAIDHSGSADRRFEAIRNALTEQAETHARELRAYEATVQNLEQRIRQLEHELQNKQFEAQSVPEVIKQAISIAAIICDAIPGRLHEVSGDDWQRHIGRLVNERNNGRTGYDIIRDAEEMIASGTFQESAQPVPVVGEPVAWGVKKRYEDNVWFISDSRFTAQHYANQYAHRIGAEPDQVVIPLFDKPTNSIPAADLATLREKAAMVDELQKRAERMQKALSDIAEWTDRYTTPGHPVSTIASAAIAQGKGE